MGHGYEDIGVDEIRRKLSEEYEVTDPEVLNQTKRPLVQLLIEKEKTSIDLDINLDNTEEDEEEVFDQENIVEASPTYGSPKWSEYVMQQFTEDELENNNPKCDGCRRVVEQLLGPIVASGIADYTPASKENSGTATVVYSVELSVTEETHPLYGQNLAITDIADVGKHNTDMPYANYAAATAATRAESRCYRKLLRLSNTVAAEEISEIANTYMNDTWQPDDPIDENQINVIDLICRRLDISVIDFINSGQQTYESIYQITKSTAQKMLQELNNIQRGDKEKASNLDIYQRDWLNNKEN